MHNCKGWMPVGFPNIMACCEEIEEGVCTGMFKSLQG